MGTRAVKIPKDHGGSKRSPLVKRFLSLLFFAVWILPGIQPALAQEPTRIYYVRHGQGGHNVVSEWNSIPKDQWPPYVGNENMFTPKGEQQVAALTKELQGMKFDFIATSPIWRARNTILPYLKETSRKAEIWPELAETPGVPVERIASDSKPSADLIGGGETIRLPEAEQPFFLIREDGKRQANLKAKDPEQQISNSLALARKTADLIKERFGKSGKSILLVGHGNSGVTLLRTLTTPESLTTNLKNTGIWMAEEQPDGSFRLKLLNSKPCPEK
jgi:broad specificity phosphatase PhoE